MDRKAIISQAKRSLIFSDNNKQKIHEILNEIKSVRSIKSLFTDGWCYNLALILWLNVPNSNIYFDPIKKHYFLEYQNELFDINGSNGTIDRYPNPLEKDNTKQDLIKLINKNHK